MSTAIGRNSEEAVDVRVAYTNFFCSPFVLLPPVQRLDHPRVAAMRYGEGGDQARHISDESSLMGLLKGVASFPGYGTIGGGYAGEGTLQIVFNDKVTSVRRCLWKRFFRVFPVG